MEKLRNMKTPEEILNEVAGENMINIQQMVTTKQLVIIAMRRYAKLYHESEVKKCSIPADDELIQSPPCDHKWKEYEGENCRIGWRCSKCKEVKYFAN